MKKMLRAVLGWLDRKFPDKVMVTQTYCEELEKRLKYLEAEITKFNMTWGFGKVTPSNDFQTTAPRGPFTR